MMEKHNIAQPQSVAEVAELVKRLYQPGDPILISSIQDQLQQLQRSDDGWQLADALLASDDANVRFFGVLTFIVKLKNDGDLLDAEAADSVLQRLISWLARLVNQGETPMVLRKLTSALVTYFLISPAQWKRPLYHLMRSLRHGDAAPSDGTTDISVEQLVQTLDSAQLTTLLWFAGSLAEDAGRIEHSSIVHAFVHAQMEEEVNDASTLMAYSLSYEGKDYQKPRGEALQCFLAWTTYAQPLWPSKPEALQLLRDLVGPAMQCLVDSQTESQALEVFVDLLESYTSFFQSDHLDTLASVIQSRFTPQLELFLRDNGPVFTPAVPFIISYGIAVVQDVVEDPASLRAQATLTPLGMILRSNGFPGDDDELSAPSIEFWNTYIEYLDDTYFSEGEANPSWVEPARTVAFELVRLLHGKMQVPPTEIAKEWTGHEREEFMTFRTDAADLLACVYIFLRTDLLARMVDTILKALAVQQWRVMEVGIFSLNCMADNVLSDNDTDEILTPLFASALFRQVGDFTQDIPSQARRTTVDMVGNYGPFLTRYPEYIPDAVRLLFASLETAALADISAKSISILCSACRSNLTGELDGFLAQYQRFAAGPTGDSYTKGHVIGGIASIIEALKPEDAKVRPLLALMENVEHDIALSRGYAKANDPAMATSVGVTALQCLASIGKNSGSPEEEEELDIAREKGGHAGFWTNGEGKVVQDRITGCFSTLDILGGCGEAIDAVCQVIRSGLVERRPGPFVLPPSVTVRLVQQCAVTTPQLESVLSTACLLISHHARSDPSNIADEVHAIYDRVVAFVQDLGQPRHDPSVGQSCIDVFSRLLPSYASTLFGSSPERLTIVLRFALGAIEGPDPMPKRSGLEFWAKIIKAAGPPQAATVVRQEMGRKAGEVLNAFGPSLAQSLMRQIAGMGQRSDLDYFNEPMKALFSLHPANAKVWVEAALWSDTLPPLNAAVGDAEKRRFLQQLVGLRGGVKTRDTIKAFYVACRGIVSSYG